MLTKLLAVCVLAWPCVALADVTYTYTGAKFDNVNVVTIQDPEVPPAVSEAASAAAKAVLLNDQIGLTLTTPIYLPQGWTALDPTGIYGALAAPLYDHQAINPGSGVSWTFTNSAMGGAGQIALDNVGSFDPWSDSALRVSVHVSAGNVIDAWEISFAPGEMYGPPNWDVGMSSSSSTGDTLLYEFGAAHFYQRREAATDTIGSWTISGSPVTAVPEAGAATMLLAGLGAMAALRRRRA